MLTTEQCDQIRTKYADLARLNVGHSVIAAGPLKRDIPALLDTVQELRDIIQLIDDNARVTDIMLISDDAEERIRKALE